MKPLDDLTAQCIRCGFCLEACPTFKLTGSELESPRGRIYLSRSANEGVITWADAKPHLDRCLGCLACEPACPSAVRYGDILELARERIENEVPSGAKSLLVDLVTSPEAMRLAQATPISRMPDAVGRIFGNARMAARVPRAQSGRLPPLTGPLPPVVGEVYVLDGCAMRVLFPRAHAATRRLLRRVGYRVREVDSGCCGSMHAHNGFLEEAASRAEALTAALPDDLPVIVDSAGCGSTMKRYEVLLPGASAFANRVFDAAEFLHAHGLPEALAGSRGLPGLRVTYQDACHLAHGQGITVAPRELLNSIPGVEFVELAEPGVCCGSAGIYNVVQPELARQLLDRKTGHIVTGDAAIVATGNPGCHAWLAQGVAESGGRAVVRHTMEVLEAAFIGLEPFA